MPEISLPIQKAINLYLENGKEEWSTKTLRTRRGGLKNFKKWTKVEGIEETGELNGAMLHEFKRWRKDNNDPELDDDIKKITLNSNLSVLDYFLQFLEKLEAVDDRLHEKVDYAKVSDEDEVRTDAPPVWLVESISEYLEKHEPTSRRRLEFEVFNEIGVRLGTARNPDEEDHDREEQTLKISHRPADDPEEVGTPLKNNSDGDRHLNLSSELNELISDHLDRNDRPDVTDEFGRNPLLVTKNGRVDESTIRRDMYKISRPCLVTGECPHDREIENCEAVQDSLARKCPSSFSPHPLRARSITDQLKQGVPKEILSNRVDVSPPILEKHYDERTDKEKAQQRRHFLEKVLPSFGADPEDTLSPSDLKEARSGEQRSLNEFGDHHSTAVHPLIVALLSLLIAGEKLQERVARELHDLAPPSASSPYPSSKKLAKGVATYMMVVFMLSIDLLLAGVL